MKEAVKSKCKIPKCQNECELYTDGNHDTQSSYCAYHGETEEGRHEVDCFEGRLNFVPCDEWEPTCLYCGKFQT